MCCNTHLLFSVSLGVRCFCCVVELQMMIQTLSLCLALSGQCVCTAGSSHGGEEAYCWRESQNNTNNTDRTAGREREREREREGGDRG